MAPVARSVWKLPAVTAKRLQDFDLSWTPIWWRSARFSSASSRFVRNDDLAAPKMTCIKLNTGRTLLSKHAAAQGSSHG